MRKMLHLFLSAVLGLSVPGVAALAQQVDTTGIYGERKDSLSAAVFTVRTEIISASGLMKMACCNLSESFENSASVTAVRQMLKDYPQSRVQDIYKSFCQDNLGPGHLIPDPEYARNYLREELAAMREDLDSGRYEAPARMYAPVGDQGNYVRVDLAVVLDGLVSEEDLLDAFVRSANEGRKVPAEQWVDKWNGLSGILRRDFSAIPDAQRDIQRIDSLVREGHLILHHSIAFEQAYHPHYRIIAKDIFETELKPRIDR
ncbi:MAG: hypothetical protein IJV37_03210 [Bacteroidales bacterium]|nr:hypothetical protein [Bacteroidales bacterium]